MDYVEKIGNSLIQHGKENDRVYLFKCNENNPLPLIQSLDKLCETFHYGKIFAKIHEKEYPIFLLSGYLQEAYIPDYFIDGGSAFLMAKYFKTDRSLVGEDGLTLLSNLLSSETESEDIIIPTDYIFRIAAPSDCEEMAVLYKEVFETYPFPIFDPAYLRKTMSEREVIYFGIWYNNRLVALSSAELDAENMNAEMTDFAVLPEMRGKKIASFLLQKMELEMQKMNYKTAYTIARLQSPGMNKTFINQGYRFSGLLRNNTNISGKIESMNVYYKNIQK